MLVMLIVLVLVGVTAGTTVQPEVIVILKVGHNKVKQADGFIKYTIYQSNSQPMDSRIVNPRNNDFIVDKDSYERCQPTGIFTIKLSCTDTSFLDSHYWYSCQAS
jgi:hypothetical protein